MQNLKNFLLVSKVLGQDKDLIELDDHMFSNYSPVVHKGHFCFIHGILHNETELFSLSSPSLETIEAVLIEQYLDDPLKFPLMLIGNFSLVIGNKEHICLLRDGNGYENLYFSLSSSSKSGIMISNSIKEIAKYHKLEVNTSVLPGYFIKTDINSGDTFFKDILTLAFFEFAIISRESLTVQKKFFDDFFTLSETSSFVNIKEVINECDNLIGNIINEKFHQMDPDFKIINALSGGTDSSFIQYYLKKNNSNIAYTANFLKTGLDHAYATDVANLLKLEQKTIQSDTRLSY